MRAFIMKETPIVLYRYHNKFEYYNSKENNILATDTKLLPVGNICQAILLDYEKIISLCQECASSLYLLAKSAYIKYKEPI